MLVELSLEIQFGLKAPFPPPQITAWQIEFIAPLSFPFLANLFSQLPFFGDTTEYPFYGRTIKSTREEIPFSDYQTSSAAAEAAENQKQPPNRWTMMCVDPLSTRPSIHPSLISSLCPNREKVGVVKALLWPILRSPFTILLSFFIRIPRAE